jgi:hypothetical protein
MSDYISRPIFDFPYFTFGQFYQDNTTRVRFGQGYTFAARPDGPPQRTFKLRFGVLRWETDPNGLTEQFTRRETNLKRLEMFYRDVEMWKTFWFNHPGDGLILVRFSRPLEIPGGIEGGNGAVGPIEIEFIEQPLPWPTPQIPSLDWSFDSATLFFDSTVSTMDEQGV